MNLLLKAFSTLRTWLGLGDPSDDHLTPSHGWLLPPAENLPKVGPQPSPVPARSPLR